MVDKKVSFQIDFPENLKKEDGTTSSTPRLSFDDLGDFIHERERLKRLLDQGNEATLRVDYSDFSNHVFFDSAESKFLIAKDRILLKYPYNGDTEEKDAYFLTSSGYENYILEQWPRYVGYVDLNGASQFVSSSDNDNKLYIGTSSFCISAYVNPAITSQHIILQVLSASATPILKNGYDFYFSGATDPHVNFSIYSGSQKVTISASYSEYTGSFSNIAAIYDNEADLLSLYIDGIKKASGTVNFNSIEFAPTKLFVGSGSQYTSVSSSYAYYSGSINEVRILMTGSSAFYYQKNFDNPIDAEDFVVLNYKFNEGITETGSIDSVVVDYSKSGLHGVILDYATGCRVSGSVMADDPGDPILYSFHSAVQSFSGTQSISASLYDKANNNQIFNLIPEYIISADRNEEGLMTAFSLAMARFFDELKLYIDQFDNLKSTNYDDLNDTPDLFLPYLTRYFGWKTTEHFDNANPLSFFFGKNVLSSGSLGTPLYEIKNQFWRRTLNNLPYLLKTKGKRSNIDSFFNVLGVNKENINLKEFGYLPGGSIQDTRIHKEKVFPFLGIGTGSLSSSFVKVPSFVNGANNAYTVEAFIQLPFASASYGSNLSVLTGSIWQFVDSNQVTGSFSLLWNVDSLGSTSGKFILTGSTAAGAGQVFSSSYMDVFDGDFVYIAAGLKADQKPFIEIRTLDNDRIDFSASFVGDTALSGVFTGSKYDFIIGATSGTFFGKQTQGYFGQFRYWNRPLSASEIEDHAYNFESIGVRDPVETPHPLRGCWALNENKDTDIAGNLNGVQDLSRLGNVATGSLFLESDNPYKKFLVEYNYLSPAVDLKWTENKIRIRNKNELKISDVATDTNEVSLEFNLIDALNRDITKIFSSFELLNQAVGSPVNKYRDEYVDLDAYSRVYFDRLGDSIHFSAFFNLFKWFDKKLSDSIKQLLPARVKFIGGEQVVESHMLERPRYGYKYPIFRTPIDIPNAELSGVFEVDGAIDVSYGNTKTAMGTYANTAYERQKTTGLAEISPQESLVVIESEAAKTNKIVSHYNHGDDRPDRHVGNSGFYRTKYSGDTNNDSLNPNSAINFKNEYSRNILSRYDRDNFDGYRSGSFVNSKIGNAFLINNIDSSKDQEHYFGSRTKVVGLVGLYNSGNVYDGFGELGPDNIITYDNGVMTFITTGQQIMFEFSASLSLKGLNSSIGSDFTSSLFANSFDQIVYNKPYILSYEVLGSASPEDMISGVDLRYDSVGYAYQSYMAYPRNCLKFSLWDGWTRYLQRSEAIDPGFYTPLEMNLKKNTILLGVLPDVTASIRNLKLEFLDEEPLSNYGAKFFTNLQNSKINTYYYNNDVFPNTDSKWYRGGFSYVPKQGKIGPRMLCSSFKYTVGGIDFCLLNNISEFPHSMGIFQMPNLVLGTTTSGKTGKSKDSIIQVNHIGSVVKVMWPKQDDQNIPVKGYGDFSVGQRVGKLTTEFDYGDSFDVVDFDHLSLYCYLRKEISGTLDNIEIKVERKPLKSAGFATDQAIGYESSGSYTVAKLTDVIYKKEIDYGDLSIREIGFPIDVPLTNVKEVRVSVRHVNGQSEENKNLIIWGRLIRSSKDTNET